MRKQALEKGLVDQDSFEIGEAHNLVPFKKRKATGDSRYTWAPCRELHL